MSIDDHDVEQIVQSVMEGRVVPELTDEQRLGRAGVRQLDVAAMLTETPPAYDWLIDGYLEAGELTWLVGKGKAGKSIVALFAAAAMLEGRPFLGLDTRRCERVAYLDAENRPTTVHRRIHACGLSPALGDRLTYYSARGLDLTTPPGIDALRIVAQGADLVVIDSLVAIHSGDENDAVATRRLVTAIRAVLEECGATGLGLAHEKHGGGLRGSTDWTNAVDRTLYLAKDDAGYRTLRPGDVRDGSEDVPHVTFRFASDGGRLVLRHLEGAKAGRPTADTTEMVTRIAHHLRQNPGDSMRATERALGVSHGTKTFAAAWKVALKSGGEMVETGGGDEMVVTGGDGHQPDTTDTTHTSHGNGETSGGEIGGDALVRGVVAKLGGGPKGPPPTVTTTTNTTSQAVREQTLGEP